MGISLKEHLSNEEVRRRASLECISTLVRRAKLKWFGHVVRRDEEDPIKRAWKEPVVGGRSEDDRELDGETEWRKR